VSAPGIHEIKARGALVVAVVNAERYPFFYTDAGGTLVGSDIDLGRDIARELGVELIINRSAASFDGTVALVAQGEADMAISKLSITLPRTQRVQFTQPYITLGQGLLINRVQLAATKQQDGDPLVVLNTSGQRLGAVQGTSYVDFARRLFLSAEIVLYPTREATFAAVEKGEITAVVYDENEIKQYLFARPERLIDLKAHLIEGSADRLGIAVASENSQLRHWVDTYLQLKQVDLNISDLLKRYKLPAR
jgi:ABC-type amino acid transport substrate-binding protein